MYDLIDIIDVKISGMEYLIEKWVNNNHLIKASLLDDIKSIKININKYHNRYVNCKYWMKDGKCRYGSNCWYLHPTSNDNNNKNSNNNSNDTKFTENKEEFSENIPEFSSQNTTDNINNEYESDDSDYNNNNSDSDRSVQTKKKEKKRRYKKKNSKDTNIDTKQEGNTKQANLENYLKQTNNAHWKHLIRHYECGICFKYMNGNCKEKNCKFKHPSRCKNYSYNNKCKYKDSCNFAHIQNRNEIENENDNGKNEKDKNNNNKCKDNNKNNQKKTDNNNDVSRCENDENEMNNNETENETSDNEYNFDSERDDNSVRYQSEPEINLDDYSKDENGNILFDTLDEYIILTEKGIPCKKRNSNFTKTTNNNKHTSDDDKNDNDNKSIITSISEKNDSIISNQFCLEYMRQTFSKEVWNAIDQLDNEQKNAAITDWKQGYNEDEIKMAWEKCNGNVQQISSYIKTIENNPLY